jgi:alpha-tubulin suppressor-like RCC1 family protein
LKRDEKIVHEILLKWVVSYLKRAYRRVVATHGNGLQANPLYALLLGMSLFLGCHEATYAVTPKVAAGSNHSVGLKADGTVATWGDDSNGQLGVARVLQRVTPIATTGIGKVRSIAAGGFHTVALKTDGSVWAWGWNDSGQLGTGSTQTRTIPTAVVGLSGVTAIAAGWGHTVALKADGSVRAWGANDSGQLGDGGFTDRTTPVAVPGLRGVVAIAAGYYHTVAIKADGSVWAWGWNDSGQLGDGSTQERTVPTAVPGISKVSAVVAGEGNTYALKADGSVWAWGINAAGNLGDGSYTSYRTTPAAVPGLIGVIAIAAGDWHAVALKVDGSVWTWGANHLGQLGNGRVATPSATPGAVPGLSAVVAIAAGGYGHSVVLKTDGSVWAWGADTFGQLGDGDTNLNHTTSSAVPGLNGVAALAAGYWHTVALKSDGSVWTWGGNNRWQLGYSGITAQSTPTAVPGLSGVIAIAAGAWHTVALKADGSVWTWGGNGQGQLGDWSLTDHYAPTAVPGLSGVIAIAAGELHTIALKGDGSVWAWGDNDSGQLGDGSYTSQSAPAAVPGLTGVIAIAGGKAHTVALKADGSVRAWGANDSGQLGDGVFTDRTTPVAVPGLRGVVAIAAGYYHTVAIKADGSVWSWGGNYNGQLGDGGFTTQTMPVAVPALRGVVAISAGYFHSLALKPDGSVGAWGRNGSGQLGDGTLAQRTSPVLVVNLSVDGFLNLLTGTTINVPLEFNVPFFLVTSGAITDTSASVTTTINFNATASDTAAIAGSTLAGFHAADAGTVGSVYVTGMVPPAWPAPAASPDASGFVLKQLTPSGWQLVVNGQLIPYASGVLNDLLATQKILDGIDTTNLKGAVFCLGYGTSAPEMTASGRMRAVATIPGDTSSASVSCNIAASAPAAPLTGLWWNQTESGWGISITQHSAMIFLAWYTYDATGNPVWYVIPSCPVSNNNACSGTIYQVTGGTALSVPWNGSAKAVATAGLGSLTFYDNNRGVLNYTLNGASGVKAITRQVFMTGAAPPAVDYSDLWWNASESGWGVALTQQFGTIFATLYSYDNGGKPRWYVASNCPMVSNSCTGDLYQVSGGSSPNVQWNDAGKVVKKVGSARFTFSGNGSGTMNYDINGATGTKVITRQAF